MKIVHLLLLFATTLVLVTLGNGSQIKDSYEDVEVGGEPSEFPSYHLLELNWGIEKLITFTKLISSATFRPAKRKYAFRLLFLQRLGDEISRIPEAPFKTSFGDTIQLPYLEANCSDFKCSYVQFKGYEALSIPLENGTEFVIFRKLPGVDKFFDVILFPRVLERLEPVESGTGIETDHLAGIDLFDEGITFKKSSRDDSWNGKDPKDVITSKDIETLFDFYAHDPFFFSVMKMPTPLLMGLFRGD
ncbi:unnamed protein product [Caenorhabditis sp. 36 PRJEB53466]|nr:unnamed protein product [Caenorhabditis sp. 36 PRJEB53466]